MSCSFTFNAAERLVRPLSRTISTSASVLAASTELSETTRLGGVSIRTISTFGEDRKILIQRCIKTEPRISPGLEGTKPLVIMRRLGIEVSCKQDCSLAGILV